MERGRSRQSRRYQYALIALCAVFLLSAGLLVWYVLGKEPAQDYSGDPVAMDTLEYNGKRYRLREDQTVILVMGLDTFERPADSEGYINHQQADFLALLILDEEAKTCNVLHLNRDTMTTIRRLGVAGDAVGDFEGQLALAHTYGSGGSDSCLNAVRAVRNLLGGVKIHHYVTLTMDAVGTINDRVGGVTVNIMDDFTALDPAMVQGQDVTLMGEQALLYVRARGELADKTNLHRMERQRQYLNALYDAVLKKQQEDENFLSKTLLKVSDGFVSDCTVNQLDELADILMECRIGEIQTVQGEAVVGERFMEFYPDEEALKAQTVALFYEKAE